MAKLFSRISALVLLAAIVVVLSVCADVGSHSWLWFQRSGSIVTLIGAILGYRSIVRLGKAGVGGANMSIVMGKAVASSYEGGTPLVTVELDEATSKAMLEAENDKRAGYVGAFMIVIGTLIWGYGDLVGRL